MQIVSIGDNLHEISKLVFLEKNKINISICRQQKILHRVLSVNGTSISSQNNGSVGIKYWKERTNQTTRALQDKMKQLVSYHI